LCHFLRKVFVMLIKHLRDDNRKPFATIVGLSGSIGVAICRERNIFKKTRGVDIALGRAQVGTSMVVPNRVVTYWGNRELVDVIAEEVCKMDERAKKYYK